MRQAADWIAGQLDFAAGRVEQTDGHPVVRGEWLGAPGAPTVLVYGHYDVQPTGDDAEWLSPPFHLTVDNDGEGDDIARGRGVSDDKGPVLLVVAMLQGRDRAARRTAGQREVPVRGRGGNRQPAPGAVPDQRTREELACRSGDLRGRCGCGGRASRRCRWAPRDWSASTIVVEGAGRPALRPVRRHGGQSPCTRSPPSSRACTGPDGSARGAEASMPG